MDGKKSIQELTVAFDRALVAAGYSESRLTNFRTVIKRLLIFGAAQELNAILPVWGRSSLKSVILLNLMADLFMSCHAPHSTHGEQLRC